MDELVRSRTEGWDALECRQEAERGTSQRRRLRQRESAGREMKQKIELAMWKVR